MAYGITDKSQLIDYETIRRNCEQYKIILEDFKKCGEEVVQAGEACNQDALSIDESTMQETIVELGVGIQNAAIAYANSADQLVADAIKVYNAQVAELNEYLRRQSQQNSNSN